MPISTENKDKFANTEPVEKLLQLREKLQSLELEAKRIQKVIDDNSRQYHELLDLYPTVSAYEQASEIVKSLDEKWPVKLSHKVGKLLGKVSPIKFKLLSLFPKLKYLYDRAIKNLNSTYDTLIMYLDMLEAEDVEDAIIKYYEKMQKALVIFLQMNEELSRQLGDVKKDAKEVSARIEMLTRAFPYVAVLGSMSPEMISKLPQRTLSIAFESLKSLTEQQSVTIQNTDDIAFLKQKWTSAIEECKEAAENLKVIQCKYDVIVNGQLSASFKRWESYLRELCSAVEPNKRRAAIVAGNMKKLFMDCTRREELLIKHKQVIEQLSIENNKLKGLEAAIHDLKIVEKAFIEGKALEPDKEPTITLEELMDIEKAYSEIKAPESKEAVKEPPPEVKKQRPGPAKENHKDNHKEKKLVPQMGINY